mmetsp:Transcript_35125/g.110568  ORF Transcript_35125/g.110568 Transcript_35125/m.110568 type:complete len:249 (-) Transcript_35125:483-1229(-)
MGRTRKASFASATANAAVHAATMLRSLRTAKSIVQRTQRATYRKRSSATITFCQSGFLLLRSMCAYLRMKTRLMPGSASLMATMSIVSLRSVLDSLCKSELHSPRRTMRRSSRFMRSSKSSASSTHFRTFSLRRLSKKGVSCIHLKIPGRSVASFFSMRISLRTMRLTRSSSCLSETAHRVNACDTLDVRISESPTANRIRSRSRKLRINLWTRRSIGLDTTSVSIAPITTVSKVTIVCTGRHDSDSA